MKRPDLQNKRVGVLRMAFRVRKVFGTCEKRAPGGHILITVMVILQIVIKGFCKDVISVLVSSFIP